MVLSNSNIVKVIILFCVYGAASSGCDGGRINKNMTVSAVIVFGDSFVDQGNNNYISTLGKANFLPYGKDFMDGKPTGRFCNGKTIPDFLAEALGVKDYVPASLDPFIKDKDLQTGVSFASGGSGFDPLTPTIASAIPMSVQLNMFKQYIEKLKRNIEEEAVNNIITNSLVVIVAGNNDLLITLPIRRSQLYDAPAYSNMLAKLVLNFIQEIYMLGVRKIVVFNVPPIGCLPDLRTLAGGPHRMCVDKENNVAQLFNTILTQQIQFWATSFPQFKVFVFDYYSSLISIIENPHEYGIDVADKGCCGTGEIEVSYLCNELTPTCPNDSRYLFWDGFHLTEKGNYILANQIVQDLMNTLF